MRVFVATSDEGEIEKRFRTTDPNHTPPGYHTELSKEDAKKFLGKRINNFRLDEERLREKEWVVLTTNKQSILADGVDTAIVSFDKTPVRVQLGKLRIDVPEGEDLEITSNRPGVVVVNVVDPYLQGDGIKVRATAPPGQGEA